MGADALIAANQLRELARLSQMRLWIQRAENVLGIIQADLGNIPDALAHYCISLKLAREQRNHFAETSSLINLGVALNYSGLYREAIPCFKEAAVLARSNNITANLEANAATNLAQSYLSLGEHREGFEAIVQSLDCSADPTDADSALSRTIRESTFVLLALELERFDDARKHADLCRRFANLSQTGRSSILADATVGLCEIFCGNLEKGLKALEAASANADQSSAIQIDALSLLVKAYDRAGQPDEALHCLKKLLQHLGSAREKSVAALLSFSSHSIDGSGLSSSKTDLAPLKQREASLRAQVAERQLFTSQVEMLERLSATADLREDQSGQHGYRVGKLSALLAQQLNWNSNDVFLLEIAARLHDIGKIGIPDRILFTSDNLKKEQRDFMFAHTTVGAELLSRSTSEQLRTAEQIARHHHEWWDGTGYPTRLSGKRIPVHARIVALADVFDALTHGRPYAEPWGIDRALEEVASRRGTQFDPILADGFIRLVQELRQKHPDLEAWLSQAGQESPLAEVRGNIRKMLSLKREREQREFNGEQENSGHHLSEAET
jgi:putative two-component system response regulator